jgi:hypothetical protein
MSRGSQAELEQRRDAVLARLLRVRSQGTLPAALVREAAAAVEVSPRTVYRWLAAGSEAWVLPERAFELLVR